MAKHQFGIMKNEPMYEERFDEYVPNKYNNYINLNIKNLQKILCKCLHKTFSSDKLKLT